MGGKRELYLNSNKIRGEKRLCVLQLNLLCEFIIHLLSVSQYLPHSVDMMINFFQLDCATGCPDINIISGCFLMRLVCESVDSVKQIALPMWVGLI